LNPTNPRTSVSSIHHFDPEKQLVFANHLSTIKQKAIEHGSFIVDLPIKNGDFP
jgi:hypothetical protein